MQSSRDIDLVLLGATGYTGRLCAEHIVQYLPAKLKWGVAGRSRDKLETLVEDLRQESVDRNPPGKCSHTRITAVPPLLLRVRALTSSLSQR